MSLTASSNKRQARRERPGLLRGEVRRLRTKGVRGYARFLRYILLDNAHRRLHDNFRIRREAVPTGGEQAVETLDIESANAKHCNNYEACHFAVIDWLQAELPRDLGPWTFLDIGAGKGRVVLEAARRPYKSVIGVEFARELAEAARANVAALRPSEQRSEKIEIRQQDVVHLQVPDGRCIFFLFNPFSEPVMEAFLNNVIASYRRDPRPMIFLYLNPVEDEVFEIVEELRRYRLTRPARAKFWFLSPHRLSVYATQEALPLLASR